MVRQRRSNIDISEQDFAMYMENEHKKPKKHIFIKMLLVILVLGLLGQVGYFLYTNKNLILKPKPIQAPVVVTPKEQLVLTPYETKTSDAVKAFPTFVGSKEEAVAVSDDFAAKYLTMSNLKTQLDFLGTEYLYPSEGVKQNFKEYALTNYYYYFPDLQKKFGKEGLPEIENTKTILVETISYTHNTIQKVPGYNFALSNELEKDPNFMKKKFKGYSIEMNIEYLASQRTMPWMKNAPDTMKIVLLFDADSGKWFVSEFQTSLSTKKANDTIIKSVN
ncbi:MAG: hypothetical protein ACRCV7_04195 [Culicoidibacterales bacterium]